MSEPMESHGPQIFFWDCSCIVTRDMSASDEPVNVETGLVLADVNELSDC